MLVLQEAPEARELEQTLDRLEATQITQQPIPLASLEVGGTPEIMVRLARQVTQEPQAIQVMLAMREIQGRLRMRQLVLVELVVLVVLVAQLLSS